MNRLDPQEGKWIILRGANQEVLDDLSQIIPTTFALTYHRSVHTLTPEAYENIIRNMDNAAPWAAPFGIGGVLYSGLMYFNFFLRVSADRDYYSHAVQRLFSAWDNSRRSVIFTVPAFTSWNERSEGLILKKIRRAYGKEVMFRFRRRAEIVLLPGDKVVRKLPVTKAWEE